MDANKREIRNLDCELSYREATPEEFTEGKLGTITGRAIVFNSESKVIDEHGQTFREVIAPEAASLEWLNTQDIKINMLHQRELTFGRCKRGESGNARISVDAEGVNVEVDIPNCDLGIRARELTKAGVLDGMSFEFWPDKYDIQEREHEPMLIRHTHFRAITALTLGMDPAYQHTSLSVRELTDRCHQEEECLQKLKREQAEEEEKKKAEEEAAAAAKAEAEKAATLAYEYRKRKLSIENY